MDVIYDARLNYIQTHTREARRVSSQNRRARKAGCEATLTTLEWFKTVNDFNGKCAYCLDAPYEVLEHFLPLFWKGGTTSTNCVPCCRCCNGRKTSWHPDLLVEGHDWWGDVSRRIQSYLTSRKSHRLQYP